MTLRELQAFLHSIDFDATAPKLTNPGKNFKIGNLKAFRDLMQKLETLPLLIEERKRIEESSIFRALSSELHFDNHNEPQGWISQAWRVINGLTILREVLDQLLPPQAPETISIKLPEPKNLDDAVKSLTQTNQAISQNVLDPKIGGRVELTSWQPGSFWIELYLGSFAAVSLVAKMARAGLLLYRQHLENSIVHEAVRTLAIQNDAREVVAKGLDAKIKTILKAEAKAIQTETFQNSGESEQLARLEMGIETFFNLIKEGGEIQPSLASPPEIKEAFPDYKHPELAKSTIKLLSQATCEEKTAVPIQKTGS
jgi:hypothetical protein